MSEVKRYAIYGDLVEATEGLLKLYPMMSVYVLAADFDRVTAERDAAQGREKECQRQLGDRWKDIYALRDTVEAHSERLTAADVRADVLEGLLHTSLIAMKRIYQAGYDRIIAAGSTCDTPEYMMESDPTVRDIMAALKPAEGGGDA